MANGEQTWPTEAEMNGGYEDKNGGEQQRRRKKTRWNRKMRRMIFMKCGLATGGGKGAKREEREQHGRGRFGT